MLVLVEGPDRCGKSTLARRVADRFELPLVHRAQPTRPVLHEYVTSLDEDFRRVGPATYGVADRWYMGQAVYPLLYPEGRTPLRDSERLWIELALLARGAFVIGAMDDPARIRDRVEADPDSYLRPEHVETCHALYETLLRDSLLACLQYHHEEEFDLDRLHGVAEVYERRTRYLGEDLVIGDLADPLVMLVGDQVNREEEAEHRLPFAPTPSSSGEYLLDGLHREWTREELRRVLVVNSRRPAGEQEDLVRVHRLAGQPRVVALGRLAQRVLEDQGVPHGAVPHPQWTRRFRYHDKSRYAATIKEAAVTGEDLTHRWRVPE